MGLNTFCIQNFIATSCKRRDAIRSLTVISADETYYLFKVLQSFVLIKTNGFKNNRVLGILFFFHIVFRMLKKKVIFLRLPNSAKNYLWSQLYHFIGFSLQ